MSNLFERFVFLPIPTKGIIILISYDLVIIRLASLGKGSEKYFSELKSYYRDENKKIKQYLSDPNHQLQPTYISKMTKILCSMLGSIKITDPFI